MLDNLVFPVSPWLLLCASSGYCTCSLACWVLFCCVRGASGPSDRFQLLVCLLSGIPMPPCEPSLKTHPSKVVLCSFWKAKCAHVLAFLGASIVHSSVCLDFVRWRRLIAQRCVSPFLFLAVGTGHVLPPTCRERERLPKRHAPPHGPKITWEALHECRTSNSPSYHQGMLEGVVACLPTSTTLDFCFTRSLYEGCAYVISLAPQTVSAGKETVFHFALDHMVQVSE